MQSFKKSNDSLILIDTSYTSFYRFFATLRWISFSDSRLYKKNKSIENYDWSQCKKFVDKYNKMYLDSIKKLTGKQIYENSKIIFCLDIEQDSIWRMDLTKSYKQERVDLSLQNNFKAIFSNTYNVLIPQLIKQNPNKIYSLQVEKLEADDLIAIISKNYEENNSNLKIYIISGDDDFKQLGRKNLFFLDYRKKVHTELSKEEALQSLKLKVLNGDKSDNIPSIFPKNMKMKEKIEIIINDNKLKKFLKENPQLISRAKLNQLLIDFNCIPKMLQKKALAEFNKLNF
jgi:5'-3' exonuclease